jgi:serine-protein kinase ATM
MALHATPVDILKLLLLCTNGTFHICSVGRPIVLSSVFMVEYELQRNAGLSRYLIQGQNLTEPRGEAPSDADAIKDNKQRARDTSNDRAVLEMLLIKFQSFREAWITLSKERASNVNADVVQIMISLIIIGSIISKLLGTEGSQICKEVLTSTRQAWALLYSFIERTEDIGSVNANNVAAAVLAVRGSEIMSVEDPVFESLSFLLPPLWVQLRRNGHTTDGRENDDMDMVDIGDSFVSQNSQSSSDQSSPYWSRKDFPFPTNQHYFQRELMLQLRIFLSDAEAARLAKEHDVPPVVEVIVNLTAEDLLNSRFSILMFLHSFTLSTSDACRLLKRIAEACIQEYDFERCEASLCLCLEVMTALAEFWVNGEDDELHDVASDMYEWFIKVLLNKGLASTQVLIHLATLLQTVLNLDLTYNNASLPSSRTSLFEILRSGSNVVKFHVAEKISRIFDRFILTEHTAILNDVIESLPHDSAKLDGIALRLYVLAKLAARWATLLRSSVYHIFETSAHIPLSVPHARNCLRTISSALKLDSPQKLFLLFAPQLLHTWLETENLKSIPFSIYGFQTLPELIASVQDEFVGQIVMRADKNLAHELSEVMETPFDTMLETSFPRAEAYSVARDISMPPSKDNASKSTESQVRKQLGTENYLRRVYLSFPQIVANLFMTLIDEHEIERAFAKRSEFEMAATRLRSICCLSSSKIILPPGQQPSFRAKYLLDELEFLCQRIGKDQLTMWISPLVVYVCRSLLDTIAPALGSLHACSVLRKVRVLVALAGPEAVQGYALEMLLQSLQPYLIKFYCAEDAVGIFWYLLDEGRGYLQQNMSFLCGIGLTTLLSLSAFLSAPQDSTTQESHYLLTLSITQSFQKWFIDFLATFSDDNHAGGDVNAFRTIITYAGDVRPPGRADKDSVEGKLLLELLEARTSTGEMLSPASFKTAIQLLCRSFTRPAKPEEDILGQDSIAIRHARVLWSLVGEIDAAEEFWTWLAEALGRSYAASGVVDSTLTMEHSHELFQSQSLGSQSSRASRSLIVDNLHDLLRSDDYTATSLAEKTLQQMITKVASQKSLDDYDECVSLAMIRSLSWHPSPCPDMDAFQKDGLELNEHAVLDPTIAPAKWASHFTVSLISSVRDDPLLGALIPILSRLPSLAVRIMPLVVHNFLAVDTRDGQPHRRKVSEAFTDLLRDDSPSLATQRRLALSTLLYLRCQPLRTETTIADRTSWLEIDLSTAAAAAASCTMYKSALLLLELHASQLASQSSRSSRRSLATKVIESPDLLRQIYQNLDDPDFFYGMEEEASLSSVMRKLSHEGENFKNLSFQSAVFDSGIKSNIDDHSGLLEALVSANMNGVARAVQAQLAPDVGQRSDPRVGPSLTALNLHQWDLPISSTASDPSSLLFQVFQTANISLDISEIVKRLATALPTLIKSITQEHIVGNDLRYSMSALAALTEIKEALSSRSSAELAAYWLKLEQREKWLEFEKLVSIRFLNSWDNRVF